MKQWICAIVLILAGLPAQAKDAQPLVGNLSSTGSDTLGNMMSLWAENFSIYYPNVNVQIQTAGSSTAPVALIAGASQLGAMSREMKMGEIADFEKRYGYAPLAIPVAVDALVVLVNRENPLQQLSLEQTDAIFSRTLRCGQQKAVHYWGDLGLSGQWQKRAIQRFGRNSASGTYGYFKQVALCNGDFLDRVNEYPGSSSVVQAVETSLNGIGYASLGFYASGVKVLPLVIPGGKAVEPSVENVQNGRYPLSRPLYIYLNKQPGKPLEPLTAAFMDFVLSPKGQKLIVQAGYLPLSPKVVAEGRETLGLSFAAKN